MSSLRQRSAASPRLSVVVPTDVFTSLEAVVECLARQTIAPELELVVVAPSRRRAGEPPSTAGALGSVRVVEHPLLPLGEARAAGVRAASAPFVVLGETHALPAPTWAERLVLAHERGWGVVVPSVVNGNPGTIASWSALLIDYGRWASGREPAEVDDPPQYNSSFEREGLLALGPRLGRLAQPGTTLAAELRSRGRHAYHEPAAQIDHLNVTGLAPWLHERFLGGRLLGSIRRARWGAARTLPYLLGSPLVPAVRFARTWPAYRAAHALGAAPRGTALAIALACVAWGVGEAVGYAVGPGRAESRMLEYELHKELYARKAKA